MTEISDYEKDFLLNSILIKNIVNKRQSLLDQYFLGAYSLVLDF